MTKPKVAFICTHNSFRSQIAEALGRHLASDVFDSYSAGTAPKRTINPDAVRLVKERYGIDMLAKGQHNEALTDLPQVDVVITMGCGVQCPSLPAQMRQNWGLDDPTGLGDDKFNQVIDQLEERVKELKEALQTTKLGC